MLPPSLDLPDDTEINSVQLPVRIANSLNEAGMRTIGEIRRASDADLLSFQRLGPVGVAYLRKSLGVTHG